MIKRVWVTLTGLLVVLAAAATQLRTTTSAPTSGPHQRPPLPSPEEIAMLPADGGAEFNRLIHEKSPYLLQHARNPVDWYPWGDEAFERAKREGKPVFLSVGYSTCHWCHVMERESFENDEAARLINEHFIAIKVDREERPDVDEIYMTATQLLTGRGGWPNSVWLTPDRKPWYAGTYFPPEDRAGMPGFKTVLTRLAEIWKSRRQDVDSQVDQLVTAMRQASAVPVVDGDVLTRDQVTVAVNALRASFDKSNGGFGGAPKFPPHSSLRLLLYEARRTGDESILNIVTRTLDAMALGGIHDHVGGGFHRYSTDARWFLPHFEKMLYDNAQLARIYTEAFLITGDREYRRVAIGICDWVLREMTDPTGAFHSALDADSEGQEGRFYLWTRDEILEVLGPDEGELFCRVYNVQADGNFRDEATGHTPGTNILYLARPLEQIAQAEQADPQQLRDRLAVARGKLLARRNQRVWPHLDDKVLTSWNGLMVGSLAYAGRVLSQPRYAEAAQRAADFILETMMVDGRLLRSYRDGQARLNAYLDDYAFLTDGLLEVHQATGQPRYLREAERLTDALLRRFRDPSGGGFFFTGDDHEDLLLRSKNPFDRAIPAGNSVAASVLTTLGRLTDRPRYSEQAATTLQAFQPVVRRAPNAAASLALAAAWYLDQPLPETGAPVPATSSGEPQADARSQEGPVTVEAFATHRRAAPGQRVHAAFRIRIDRGWHVNSHRPTQDYLIPTAISLKAGPAIAGSVTYPEGESVALPFSQEAMSVYQGTVWFHLPVEIAREAPGGPTQLVFEVVTQPCDDRRCLAPQTHVLSLPFAVSPSPWPADSRHQELFGRLGLSASSTSRRSVVATRPGGEREVRRSSGED